MDYVFQSDYSFRSEGKVVGQTEVIIIQIGIAKKHCHNHHHHNQACEGTQQEIEI